MSEPAKRRLPGVDQDVRHRGLPRGVNAIEPREAQALQRARLFQALSACIAEHGYANTAVADVLALARVSRRTFYQLFRDREDCYLALLEQGHEQLVAEVLAAQASAVGWRQHLERSHHAYLEFFVRQPLLAQALLVAVVAAGPRALAQRDRYHARFIRFQSNLYALRQQDEPELPALPEEVFAVLIHGINELVASWVREGRSSELLRLEPVLLYVVGTVHGSAMDLPAVVPDAAVAGRRRRSRPREESGQ
ncbi:MAG: TetR/AcrR family transcriptional regulator [Stagnimonas sp.]|nr:TetR/AcrR family transcriptional regulator [Stagnimonas sp.]